MIGPKQKAGEPCKGCNVMLIEEPWNDHLNRNSATFRMNKVRWLLHEDTLQTVCKKPTKDGKQ